MHVWILAIGTRYGIDITAYDTFEGAKQSLLEFVAENWDDDYMEEGIPEDGQEAIEKYFEATYHDTYYIEPTTVQGTP